MLICCIRLCGMCRTIRLPTTTIRLVLDILVLDVPTAIDSEVLGSSLGNPPCCHRFGGPGFESWIKSSIQVICQEIVYTSPELRTWQLLMPRQSTYIRLFYAWRRIVSKENESESARCVFLSLAHCTIIFSVVG